MAEKVVNLQAWRRRASGARPLDAGDIRRAGSGSCRLARDRRLRILCDSVVDALVATDHPLTADSAALLELLETLEALRAEARFQADHPVA